MSDKPKDGTYTFRVGDALPEWFGVSPGAKIERGYIKCRVHDGTIGNWKIPDNTRIEGDYYLFSDGKRISKIHIKEKKPIAGSEKNKLTRFNKRVAIWIFLGLAFFIIAIAFILNNP